ncbi:hypothetical protein DFS34DRAFT_80035 [Phlyctochytrium arcticum]|nr:hypothetical protein DFS34DRAFT_80035 [Phlyctochytrium arcticum]
MFEQYTLNPLQKAAFSMICAPVFAKMPCPESERLSIVTGPGGTGKSRIVAAIIQQIEAHFGRGSVKVMASSGSAAAAIGGTTVHKGIGIRQGAKELPDHVLTPSAESIRIWTMVKCVVIDEVSMLEPVVFALFEEAMRCKNENTGRVGGR